jgi:hypothetical protein
MTKKNKKPTDLNALAFSIVQDATEEEGDALSEEIVMEPEDEKNPHAVELGRLGGRKGGKATAENMTPEERSERARKAANMRWEKKEEEGQK